MKLFILNVTKFSGNYEKFDHKDELISLAVEIFNNNYKNEEHVKSGSRQ